MVVEASDELELLRIASLDVYRDGGSYEASFSTNDGRLYGIWLQRSGMPDADGLRHRWLFQYFGAQRPTELQPIVTGSREERSLLNRLSCFLEKQLLAPSASAEQQEQLRQLIFYIEHRESTFPGDLLKL